VSVFLDTSILVDHLRGRPEGTRFVHDRRAAGQVKTFDAVAAELFTGARNLQEQATITKLLATFVQHPVTDVDSRVSLSLLTQFRLSHGIQWIDCLIAAQALRLGLPLATTNVRHFRAVPNLQVIRPY
jgi:predicted nucleic acid-binding protein